MPDNQYELIGASGINVGKSYKCPNGHPYFIGDCGRPWVEDNCRTCGAIIGGKSHKEATGNQAIQANDSAMKSKPAHILGAHSTREGPLPERELSSLSCALLRLLTHLAMYTSFLCNKRAVLQMIQPTQPGDNVVGSFIDKHIQMDLKHIAQCCSENADDCLLLVHDIINNMAKSVGNRGADKILDTINIRQLWEKNFDQKYIRPTLDQKADNIERMSKVLRVADKVDIKSILDTKENPINADNMMSSPGLWEYSRPLTLPRVQNRQQAEREPCLKRVAEQCEKLVTVRYLPDIIQLNNLLNDRFHSKYTREEAQSTPISEFCRMHGTELTNIRKLVDSFIQAWNMATTFTNLKVLSDQSPLFDFLYDQHAAADADLGRKPYLLAECLVTIQNSMIAEEDSERVALSAVRSANVINLSGEDELLNLITSHSEYELSGETSKDYDWPSIERQVILRYINNKPRITFNREEMAHYVYQEDFNLHNQIQAIEESQERLTDRQQKAITSSLVNAPIATLTDYLKSLTVTINFLSTLPHIEREVSLYQYMRTTLGHSPTYLSDDMTLKHVRDVWLIIKYTQVEQLINRKEEAFDDIVPECREPITKELIASLDAAIMLNSPSTKLLLHELFKYIILRLNKAAIKQDPQEKTTSLRDALNGFIYERANEHDEDRAMEITTELPELPEEIQVQYAAKTWLHIWQRCHFWLQDQ